LVKASGASDPSDAAALLICDFRPNFRFANHILNILLIVLILAVDTSGSSGSVAVLDGPSMLAEHVLAAERRSAQTLAPAILRVLADAKIEPSQIRLVATTVGPGSFTGLRVGVTTAKTFAYSVGAEVLGISTLAAISHGVPVDWLSGESREIHAVLDAQRKELFVGRFRSEPGCKEPTGLPRLTRLAPDAIIHGEEWLYTLTAGTIVTGSGLNRLEGRLPEGTVAVPLEFREPQAAVVGKLAWREYEAGRRDDLWKLAPVYLRPSYAEEKKPAN
jgi:tRNA threonylcarbamoyladenosine biosynthesis protein TsaB